jgi:hypothetical protein
MKSDNKELSLSDAIISMHSIQELAQNNEISLIISLLSRLKFVIPSDPEKISLLEFQGDASEDVSNLLVVDDSQGFSSCLAPNVNSLDQN